VYTRIFPLARAVSLALAAAAAATPAAAADVMIGHFAPSIQQPITFELAPEGQPAQTVTLAYGDYSIVKLPAGDRRVAFAAKRADGSVVTQRDVDVVDEDWFVALAGAGTAENPVELMAVAEGEQTPAVSFTYPSPNGGEAAAATFLVRHAQLVPAGENRPRRLRFELNGSTNGAAVPFGTGIATTSTPVEWHMEEWTPASGPCVATLHDGDTIIDTEQYPCEGGGNYRHVAIGDGVNAPVELRILERATRPVPTGSFPAVPPMSGLWTIEHAPDVGLSIAITRMKDPRFLLKRPVVTAMLYGYDRDGDRRWTMLRSNNPGVAWVEADLRAIAFEGGKPDGAEVASGVDVGQVRLRFSSCNEGTIQVRGVNEELGLPPERTPEGLWHIKRLVPVETCAAPFYEYIPTPGYPL
jgi:hypothetical protein